MSFSLMPSSACQHHFLCCGLHCGPVCLRTLQCTATGEMGKHHDHLYMHMYVLCVCVDQALKLPCGMRYLQMYMPYCTQLPTIIIAHVSLNTYVCMHTCTHTHTHTRTHARTHVHTNTYTQRYARTHTRIQTHARTHTHVHTHACS